MGRGRPAKGDEDVLDSSRGINNLKSVFDGANLTVKPLLSRSNERCMWIPLEAAPSTFV